MSGKFVCLEGALGSRCRGPSNSNWFAMRSKRVSRPKECTLRLCSPNRIEPPQKSFERVMAQREVLQLVSLTANKLPEANELFSSWCCRGNERRGYCEAVRDPLQSRRARLRRVREQLDKQIGPVLTNAIPFAGSPCERETAAVRPACLRELGNRSAHRSSNGRFNM